MIVGNVKDLIATEVVHPDATGAKMKVLISPKEGWKDHVMRVFEIQTGGHTPKHRHPWPHINYIIEGNGELIHNDVIVDVTAGSYAYVESNSLHQFRNPGDSVFKFICIVPKEGHKI